MKNLVVLFVFSIILVSCNSENSIEKLESQNWEVTQINDSKDLSKTPTLSFNVAEKTIHGNAGCNNYFGDYTVTETNVAFNKMGATKMMCPDISVEDQFLETLEKVTMYKFEGDKLVLLSASGDELMILK